MTRLNGNAANASILPAPVTEAGTILCGRTLDADILRQFYLNHDIWDIMQPDDSPDAKDLDFDAFVDEGVGDDIVFVTSSYNGRLAALFMFNETIPHCYDIHSALLPEFWGMRLAHLLGLRACRWMVNNAACEKITTSVPSFNESAHRMAVAAGMSLEGCNRQSFMKYGQLYDQALFGFTKGELLCL